MWAISPTTGGLLLLACIFNFGNGAPVHEDGEILDPQTIGDGCYYNFEHYEEGDRILTNEPCLNCTCSNKMLMCYLRVCPFTRAIGQDCTIEKKPDQCCPVITCPQVPVALLTSSTTLAPTTTTAVGRPDTYGCTFEDNTFYADGVQVPSDPKNPCELCYCIRNHTKCVMQECTLNVAGCRPVYQEGVCCPVRYDCEHEETSSIPTTTQAVVTTISGPMCSGHNGTLYQDGELMENYSDNPCERCYCLGRSVVCAVKECGMPMEGTDCEADAPLPGECCPSTYRCANGIIPVTLPGEKPHKESIGQAQDEKHDETSSEEENTVPIKAEDTSNVSESSEEHSEPQEHAHETDDHSSEESDEKLEHGIDTTEVPKTEQNLDDKIADNKIEESLTQNNGVPNEGVELTVHTTSTEETVTKVAHSPEFDAIGEEHEQFVSPSLEQSTAETEHSQFVVDEVKPNSVPSAFPESEKTQSSATEPNFSPVPEHNEEEIPESSEGPHKEEDTVESSPKPEEPEKPLQPQEVDSVSETFSTDEKKASSQHLETNEIPELTANNVPQNESGILEETRIPGEGSCLIEGKTYEPNSNVPTANECQKSCKCINSIVECVYIECPSPPTSDYANCIPVQTSDSCCPTYMCDQKPSDAPEAQNHLSIDKLEDGIQGGDFINQSEEHTEEAVVPSSTKPIETSESQTIPPGIVGIPPENLVPGTDEIMITSVNENESPEDSHSFQEIAHTDTPQVHDKLNEPSSEVAGSILQQSESSLYGGHSVPDEESLPQNEVIQNKPEKIEPITSDHEIDPQITTEIVNLNEDTSKNSGQNIYPSSDDIESTDSEGAENIHQGAILENNKETSSSPDSLVSESSGLGEIEGVTSPSSESISEHSPTESSVITNHETDEEQGKLEETQANAQESETEDHLLSGSSESSIPSGQQTAGSHLLDQLENTDEEGTTSANIEESSDVSSTVSPVVPVSGEAFESDSITPLNNANVPFSEGDKFNSEPTKPEEQESNQSSKQPENVTEKEYTDNDQSGHEDNFTTPGIISPLDSEHNAGKEQEKTGVAENEPVGQIIDEQHQETPISGGPVSSPDHNESHSETVDHTSEEPASHLHETSTDENQNKFTLINTSDKIPEDDFISHDSHDKDEISQVGNVPPQHSQATLVEGHTEIFPEISSTPTGHEHAVDGSSESPNFNINQPTSEGPTEVSNVQDEIISHKPADENKSTPEAIEEIPDSTQKIITEKEQPATENTLPNEFSVAGIENVHVLGPVGISTENVHFENVDLTSKGPEVEAEVETVTPIEHITTHAPEHIYHPSGGQDDSLDNGNFPQESQQQEGQHVDHDSPGEHIHGEEIMYEYEKTSTSQPSESINEETTEKNIENSSSSEHLEEPISISQSVDTTNVSQDKGEQTTSHGFHPEHQEVVSQDNQENSQQEITTERPTSEETSYQTQGADVSSEADAESGKPIEPSDNKQVENDNKGDFEITTSKTLNEGNGHLEQSSPAIPYEDSNAHQSESIAVEEHNVMEKDENKDSQPVSEHEAEITTEIHSEIGEKPDSNEEISGHISSPTEFEEIQHPVEVSTDENKYDGDMEVHKDITTDDQGHKLQHEIATELDHEGNEHIHETDEISQEPSTTFHPEASRETPGVMHVDNVAPEQPQAENQILDKIHEIIGEGMQNEKKPIESHIIPNIDVSNSNNMETESDSNSVPTTQDNKIEGPLTDQQTSDVNVPQVLLENTGESNLNLDTSHQEEIHEEIAAPESPKVEDATDSERPIISNVDAEMTATLSSEEQQKGSVTDTPHPQPIPSVAHPETPHEFTDISDENPQETTKLPSNQAEEIEHHTDLPQVEESSSDSKPVPSILDNEEGTKIKPVYAEDISAEQHPDVIQPSVQTDPEKHSTDLNEDVMSPTLEGQEQVHPTEEDNLNPEPQMTNIHDGQTVVLLEENQHPVSEETSTEEISGGVLENHTTPIPQVHLQFEYEKVPEEQQGSEQSQNSSNEIIQTEKPTSISHSEVPLFPNWSQKPFEHQTTAEAPHLPEETHYPSGFEQDYEEDDGASYGPGTCRYGGKVYLSAQQIPRDDPCDFCFCFRSDIICLQQSCPPPIKGCYQETIKGFCCPRYECHVSMATMLNLTTTTTTTTTTLPPHFFAHAYKGAATRAGCQVKGVAYNVGDRIPSTSGPCLECRCGANGQMKCDPTVCGPQEALLRQVMDAAAVSRR